MRLGWARPVRSFFISATKVCTHLVMRSRASFFISSSIRGNSWGLTPRLLEGDRRTHVLAADDACQVTRIVEIEHPQRQAIVAAHHYGGRIHDVQLVREHLVEGQMGVSCGGRVALRIIRIDTVHLRCLQKDVGIDLNGAQGRRGIRSKERIAGAGREDLDTPFLQMPDGAAADVVLTDLVYADRGHDTRVAPETLERVLQG